MKSQQHRNRKSHDETLRKPHDKIKYLSNRREQRIQARPTGRTRNAELAESDIRKHLSQPAIRSLGSSKMSSFIPVKSNDRLHSPGKLERNFEMAGQFFLWISLMKKKLSILQAIEIHPSIRCAEASSYKTCGRRIFPQKFLGQTKGRGGPFQTRK